MDGSEVHVMAVLGSGRYLVSTEEPEFNGWMERAQVVGGFNEPLLPGDCIRVHKWAPEGRSPLSYTLKPGHERSCDCPVWGSCGGCPSMPLSIETETACKLRWLSYCLSQWQVVPSPIKFHSGARKGYRRRLRLSVEAHRLRAYNEAKTLACPILSDELRQSIGELQQILSSGLAAAVPSRRLHVELRAPDLDGNPGLFVEAGQDELEIKLPEVWKLATTSRGASQRVGLGTAWAWAPVRSFLQVNAEANRGLLGLLVELAAHHDVTRFVDAFAGHGNLGLELCARLGAKGIAFELHEEALTAGALSAEHQRLGLAFHRVDLSETLEPVHDAVTSIGAQLVVVDPPRAGLKRHARSLAECSCSHIALVSCNPWTLAKDLSIFQELGWVVGSFHVIDMFPCTAHLECLVWLSRVRPAR